MEIIIGQLLGLVGIILLIAVFQVDDRRKLLHIQILSNLTWSSYYIVLGAFTAAGLIALGIVRNYLFDRYRQYEWVLGLMVVMYTIVTLITWKDWTSIMALIGMIMATIALWQKKPRHIRLTSLTVTPFWLTYNTLNGSYWGIVGDLVTFGSVVIGIWRFDISPKLFERKTPDTHRVKSES